MNFAVVDVETSLFKAGEIPKTKFWGLYDGKTYRKFQTTKKLLKYLDRAEPMILLHHSNFDVIQMLVDGADIGILSSHNGRLIRCAYGEHGLLNSYSVFPVSLGSIFQSFGHKKTDLGQLEKRNYDDCVIGLECFLKLDSMFERLTGVSPLQKGTIASASFAAAQLKAGKLKKDLRFMESYRGGRVEVFDLNKATCRNYDVNSSYPFSFCDAPAESDLLHIKISTKDWTCPLFDSTETDRLIFPNGTFSSYVFRHNLDKYILPHVEKTKIRVMSNHRIDLHWLKDLGEFVQHVYEKKNASDGGEKMACKFLLNSLYGRIGLKGESERARFLDFLPSSDEFVFYPIGKKYLVFEKIFREPNANYALAAFITDNARARLFQAFKLNDCMYGDTDSVFIRGKAPFSEKIGRKLGEWNAGKIECFQARNVKDYMTGDKEVLKGGHEFLTWTLKRFASGKAVEQTTRTRQSGLIKRTVLADNTTIPLERK